MPKVIVVDLKTLQRQKVIYPTRGKAIDSCTQCWDSMERAGYELDLLYSSKRGFCYRASRGSATRRIIWFHSDASVSSLMKSNKRTTSS